MSENATGERTLCAKCDAQEAGPGGVLCSACFEAIAGTSASAIYESALR